MAGIGRDETGRLLLTLARKELIQPVASELAGEEAFRFRHALVRDSAYRGLTKQRRAELHERLARWLDATASGLSGTDEMVGHHLAEAARLGEDLRWDSDAASSLTEEAAERLARAGRRLLVTDASAAAALLERAAGLVPEDTERHRAITVDWAQALIRAHEVDAAGVLLERVTVAADEPLAWRATLLRLRMALDRDDPPPLAECLTVADRAAEAFARVHDDAGLASVHLLRAFVAQSRAQWQEVHEHVRLVAEHAAAVNDTYLLGQAAFYRYAGYAWGPTRVDDALAKVEITAATDPVDRGHRARCAAILLAYADQPDRRGEPDRGAPGVRRRPGGVGAPVPCGGSCLDRDDVGRPFGRPRGAPRLPRVFGHSAGIRPLGLGRAASGGHSPAHERRCRCAAVAGEGQGPRVGRGCRRSSRMACCRSPASLAGGTARARRCFWPMRRWSGSRPVMKIVNTARVLEGRAEVRRAAGLAGQAVAGLVVPPHCVSRRATYATRRDSAGWPWSAQPMSPARRHGRRRGKEITMVLLRDGDGRFYEVDPDLLEGRGVEAPQGDEASFRAPQYRWDTVGKGPHYRWDPAVSHHPWDPAPDYRWERGDDARDAGIRSYRWYRGESEAARRSRR